MDIPADKCAHMQLMRMPGPLPLYRCTACHSGFVLNAYLPIPPGRFAEVARQFAGSDKMLARIERELEAATNGLVLPPDASLSDGEPIAFDRNKKLDG